MTEREQHVIFGTGQVGLALAACLASSGYAVRSVSRHRPATLADAVDWRAADASDPVAATDAAKGATVIYQCLNAPYTQWPTLFPPLQRGYWRRRTHGARLTLENLYGMVGRAVSDDTRSPTSRPRPPKAGPERP